MQTEHPKCKNHRPAPQQRIEERIAGIAVDAVHQRELCHPYAPNAWLEATLPESRIDDPFGWNQLTPLVVD